MKNKKPLLILATIMVLFISLWTYFFWYPQFVLDQRIEELKKEGANVEVIVYDVFYLDMTSSSPEVVFAERQSWSAFKQDVMTAKADSGLVTVSFDREARIFVFDWNETTYYYYEVP